MMIAAILGHPQRVNEHQLLPFHLAGHHLIKQFGSLAAAFYGIERDAGKRRGGKFKEQVDLSAMATHHDQPCASKLHVFLPFRKIRVAHGDTWSLNAKSSGETTWIRNPKP